MLQFNDVSYTYPFQDTKALERVSFEVSPGEAVLCTGASGCGKSTLIRLVNGLIPHFFQGDVQGRVILQGKDNNKEHLHEISMKVGSLFQDPEEQFFALTVRDELAFALESRGVSPEEIRRRIWFEAKRFKLDHLMDATVFNLSDGEKQKVALAAILAQEPKMLVLDEPSANLDPSATRELCLILAQLKKQGMTLLIADHRLYWLRDIIDRVFIVEKGRICKTGSFFILEDPSLQSKYGLRNTYVESSTSSFCSVDSASGDGVWLENLSFAYKNQPPIFEDLNTFIPKGKVTAVMGENGSGKTTFARLLTGLLKSGSGNISLNGRPVRAEELLKKGCIILQNTDHQLHMKTVLQELFLSGKHLNKQAREQKTWHLLELFGLEKFSERHPQSLSGGQKQRLVIASGLIKEPEILILDEPTSGLDRRNMDIISRVMQELAGEGASVLVISHDLELIDKACSHVIRFPFSAKHANKHFFGGH